MTKHAVSVFAFVCLAASTSMAADSPFVGKWKLDTEKSKMTGLQETIEDLGDNKFKFAFGDDVETIMFDGKDYPTKFGSTWSVTPDGNDQWKSIHKKDGKVTSTATWTLLDGGKEFSSVTDGTRADGSTYHSAFKAKRVAGESGLAGTWEITEMKLGAPEDWEIQPYEGDGLSFVTPAAKEEDSVKFDGKDYPAKGPRVAPGSTYSAKSTGTNTMELYEKLSGKLMTTHQLELSTDGKTLTDKLTFPGVTKSEVDVYERQ
jgi:hypothetical protein